MVYTLFRLQFGAFEDQDELITFSGQKVKVIVTARQDALLRRRQTDRRFRFAVEDHT